MELTDGQIDRVIIVVEELAKRYNAWGIALKAQIDGKDKKVQRRIILGSIGQMWEAFTVLNMAMNSTRTPEQIRNAMRRDQFTPVSKTGPKTG